MVSTTVYNGKMENLFLLPEQHFRPETFRNAFKWYHKLFRDVQAFVPCFRCPYSPDTGLITKWRSFQFITAKNIKTDDFFSLCHTFSLKLSVILSNGIRNGCRGVLTTVPYFRGLYHRNISHNEMAFARVYKGENGKSILSGPRYQPETFRNARH